MKKILFVFIWIATIWLIIYSLLVCDQYLALKYEVETLENTAILNRIYEIVNTSIILGLSWFFLSLIIFVYIYIKERTKT